MAVRPRIGNDHSENAMNTREENAMNTREPDPLDPAIGVLHGALAEIGAGQIAMATLARGWICLQPVRLDDGEQIAHILGCTNPLDHRLLVPGHTLWTGTRDELEIQVRSSLRKPARRAW
ncbi:hypothetical protein [Myceligenerans pegani]|uniref:Uncharacterized protein n=1 Tax=Myceligenerans pegani TaxID=2776917 RepID=A0ABR9N274_9MICO|nr:hypothetical protein [Myceligenerans sp. TRM 65318]MBE1877756.1 hypothetical protein [Myceligenerans sp. TRM 65318]MBE3020027.1 hypothetical protein [Myceligenerans sp. TRM 65318]